MSGKYGIDIITTAGNPIQVSLGWFWQEVMPDTEGISKPPIRIHAIHVLTSEDNLTLRLKLRHEFRADFDYGLDSLPSIKAWLLALENDRRQGDFETVEEFLEDFAEFLVSPTDLQPPKRSRHDRSHEPSVQE